MNDVIIDDCDLLKQIALGDQLSIRTLFERHQNRVFRYVLRLIRDESYAEEIVNEVFFSVWAKAASFNGRSAVSTWIIAIAYKKAINHLRKCREVQLDEEVAHLVVDTADDPEIAISKSDANSLVRASLDRLNPKHRQVIDLAYYHEHTVRQIAATTGILEGTVKTRLYHARRRLAELLVEFELDCL